MSSIESVLSESVAAVRVRIAAVDAASIEAAKGSEFKPVKAGRGVAEKFLRAELDARKEALFESAFAEAAEEL